MSGILVPKPMLGRQLRKGHRSARGLVGYWLFNEGSGNKVFDLSGNGNNGTFGGDPQWVAGKFGSVIDFDGTGDYIGCPRPIFTSATQLTISVWVYQKSSGGSAFGGWVSHGGSFSTGFFLARDISEKAQFYVEDNRVKSANVTVLNDTWVHLAGVYDGTNGLKLYINGVEPSYSLQDAGPASMSSISGVEIGGNTTSSLYSASFIDHVMIWNRALNASEIALLYRKPFCMFDREPLPLWTAATQGVAPPVGMAGAMTTNTGYWGW